MSLIDKSKKHHFISQAEQKLNAINPYASNDSNMNEVDYLLVFSETLNLQF